MRTKAEALAKPMAGDRWRNGESTLTVEIAGGAGVFSFSFSGYLQDTPPRIAWHENWLPLFRRWAANAEYMGGTND